MTLALHTSSPSRLLRRVLATAALLATCLVVPGWPGAAAVEQFASRLRRLRESQGITSYRLAQLTGLTEQLAHLSGKIAKLEESLEARSSNGAGTAHDGAGIADQVRQMDERLQKLAYVLAQQNWNRP